MYFSHQRENEVSKVASVSEVVIVVKVCGGTLLAPVQLGLRIVQIIMSA